MINNSFKLLEIILIKSSFERSVEIDFSKEPTNNIGINTSKKYFENKNGLNVVVKVTYDILVEEEKMVSFEVVMGGNFEFEENSTILVEDFANIYAPAMIFPFIREHIATTSGKAGLETILLPPINFVEFAKMPTKKEDEKQ